MGRAQGRAPKRASRIGRAARWLIGAAAAGLGLFILARLFGLDTFTPMAQLAAFTPYAWFAAVLVAVLSAAARSRWLLAVSAAVVVAHTAVLLPRAAPVNLPTTQAPDDPADVVTVLTLNAEYGGADPTELAALVRDGGVDVLAVQELTPELAGALERAGLHGELPHRSLAPAPGVAGMGLYSAFPIAEEWILPGGSSFPMVGALLEAGERGIAVQSVHPMPPVPGRTGVWARELTELAELSASAERPGARAEHTVMLGDFNATLDHSLFRRLLAHFDDAHSEVDRALAATWPADSPLPPPVGLDHVLVSPDMAVLAVTDHTVTGTDHQAVLASLVPAG